MCRSMIRVALCVCGIISHLVYKLSIVGNKKAEMIHFLWLVSIIIQPEQSEGGGG